MIDQTRVTHNGTELPDEIDLRDAPAVAPRRGLPAQDPGPSGIDRAAKVAHCVQLANDDSDTRPAAPDTSSGTEAGRPTWETVAKALFAPTHELGLDGLGHGDDPAPTDTAAEPSVSKPTPSRLFAPAPGEAASAPRSRPVTPTIRIFGPVAPETPAAPPPQVPLFGERPAETSEPSPERRPPTITFASTGSETVTFIPADREIVRSTRRPLPISMFGLVALAVVVAVAAFASFGSSSANTDDPARISLTTAGSPSTTTAPTAVPTTATTVPLAAPTTVPLPSVAPAPVPTAASQRPVTTVRRRPATTRRTATTEAPSSSTPTSSSGDTIPSLPVTTNTILNPTPSTTTAATPRSSTTAAPTTAAPTTAAPTTAAPTTAAPTNRRPTTVTAPAGSSSLTDGGTTENP